MIFLATSRPSDRSGPSDQAAERLSDRVAKSSSNRAVQRWSNRMIERERVIEQLSNRAIGRSSDRAIARASIRTFERSGDRALERSSNRMIERPHLTFRKSTIADKRTSPPPLAKNRTITKQIVNLVTKQVSKLGSLPLLGKSSN